MAHKTLYLRGLPERLIRQVKVRAAEQGTTVAKIVAHALQHYLREGDPDPQIDALAEDMDWYAAEKETLLPDHEGNYIAIVGRSVVDSDADFEPLARRVFEHYGRRPVFITRCEREERIVRVPSPRVPR